MIPLWGVSGQVAFHQARPDRRGTRDGKPIKYESPNGARWRSTCTRSPSRTWATYRAR